MQDDDIFKELKEGKSNTLPAAEKKTEIEEFDSGEKLIDDPEIREAADLVKKSMRIGVGALEGASILADSTDDPAAYRVIASIMAAVNDSAVTMAKLKGGDKETPKKKTGEEAINDPSPVTIVFEGNPKEIQKKFTDIDNEK